MYLALLNKEQKELFLELSYNLALVDGDYCDREKAVIEGYCHEMQIIYKQEKMTKSTDDIINELNHLCNITEKKIIAFEAIGLVMADKKYDDNERRVVKRLAEIFNLEVDFIEKCEMVINEYLIIQDKISHLIKE